MTIDVAGLTRHLENVNLVATEYLKGSSAAEIATTLSIPRNTVETLLEEWRQMAASNEAINRKAKEALSGAVEHYTGLIRAAYEVIDEATQTGNLTAKNNAIKIIGDLEAKRVDMLHKAGLLDNNEIMAELTATQKKHKVLMDILKDVTLRCDHCKFEVMRRLSAINDEGIVVVEA